MDEGKTKVGESMTRNHYFDNLKFILIVLVVLGHFLGRYRTESGWLNGLYLFVYLFHMPVFALVSGFFSKTYAPRLKDLSFVLLPFILFQVAYIAYYQALGLKGPEWDGGWNLAMPFVQNWYLLSLLCWRYLSFAVRSMKFLVPVSFVAAILAGYVPGVGWTLSLSRTLCFFPFFVLGMRANPLAFELLKRVKGMALPLLGGLLMMGVLLGIRMPNQANLIIWNALYASGYDLPDAMISGPVYRAGVYALSLLSGAAFMAWIPAKKVWFSRLGERTMTIYLLHNFVVFGLKKLHPSYEPFYTELLIVGGTLATTALFSLSAVDQLFRYPFAAAQRGLEMLFTSKPRSK